MNRPKREAAKNAELKRQLEEQQNISDEGSVFLDDSEAESADENANGGDDDSEVESCVFPRLLLSINGYLCEPKIIRTLPQSVRRRKNPRRAILLNHSRHCQWVNLRSKAN